MATALYMSNTTALPSQSPAQSRMPLRRATYVHVSDLTSAYNIDHGRLEQELARAKADSESRQEPQSHEIDERRSPSPDGDVGLNSPVQKRLQPPRSGYNLCVLVGNVRMVVDKRRVDSSRVRLAEVEIGDETGTVSLRARDDQIDTLEEVSKSSGAVVLRNCTLELYQGKHIRLAITKWGKLATYPDSVASTPAPPSKMNRDRNFSKIDLSVVASEMVIDTSDMSYSNRGGTTWKAPDTIESSTKMNSSKSGSSTQKQQQNQQVQNLSSPKRTGRSNDRRSSRGKSQGQYTGKPVQGAHIAHPQAHYHGMHGYGRYDPSYGYPRQTTMTPASAQQMIYQQQYELQQRHFHQMYQQGQHKGHIHPGMTRGHQVQPSNMVMPSGVPVPSSFAAPDDFSVTSYGTNATDLQSQAAMTGMLVPMPAGMPVSTAGVHQQYGTHGNVDEHQRKQGTSYASAVARDLPQQQGRAMVPAESVQHYPGAMNPQASAFAPAYMSVPAAAAPQGYFYDPSQAMSNPYQGGPYGHFEASAPSNVKATDQSRPNDGVTQVSSSETADSHASG